MLSTTEACPQLNQQKQVANCVPPSQVSDLFFYVGEHESVLDIWLRYSN